MIVKSFSISNLLNFLRIFLYNSISFPREVLFSIIKSLMYKYSQSLLSLGCLLHTLNMKFNSL